MPAIRHVITTFIAILIFSLGLWTHVGLAQTPTALQTVFVKSRQFEIPVTVDSRGTDRPAELQLYVSRDSGGSWEFYSRQSPESGKFSFFAPGDGEYWFAVRPYAGRTIDGTTMAAGNQLAAAGPPLSPSLRIEVDTTEPQVNIDSSADANGAIALRVDVTDNAASASGTQLYYRITDTPAADWIAIDPKQVSWSRGNAGRITAQVSVDPRVDWRKLSIYAISVDQAGNQATAQKAIERPRVAAIPARLASTGQPASSPEPPNYQEAPLQPVYRGMQDYPRTSQSNQPLTIAERSQYEPQPAINGGLMGPLNSNTNPAAPPAANYSPNFVPGTRTNPLATPQPQPQQPPQTSSAPVSPSSVLRALEAETIPAPTGIPDHSFVDRTPAAENQTTSEFAPNGYQQTYQQGVPQNAPPQSESRFGAQRFGAQRFGAQRFGAQGAIPIDWNIASKLPIPETEINFSRQGEFSLDYEFEAIGARGIQKVELWGTRDAGQSWVYWGEDPDKTSPFDISTSESGLYGFRMVAVDGQNLTSPQPQPGDDAEIYIMVDKTAPVVKLVAARYGEMKEAGSLIIEYTYQDDNPISRPISLSFSDSPSGPWTTIATGLENDGRYAWPADPRVPKNLYLRVEATDRAGNTGIDISPTAISIRGLAPTARIKGFHPGGR